jgi:DNA polymerase/3'-5' exonuclease PolX
LIVVLFINYRKWAEEGRRAVHNTEIAAVFDDIAEMLKLKKESIFKIRAYQKAARSIEGLAVEVAQLVAEDRLREVPGVGEAISRKITELVTTGKLGYYERLKAESPEPAQSARGQVPDDGGE